MPDPEGRENWDEWAEQRRRDREAQAREAERLAEQRGAKNALIDERLATHDQRLERFETRLERLEEFVESQVTAIKTSVHEMRASQDQRDAVASALAKAVKDAGEKAVSSRTFLLGVAMLLVAIVALFVGSGHLG